ncbi:hypothetical protein [Hufsiella ginkgonis]|uniref:Glycosyltransferase n=1 Tax=Hufsiella ginkgonis TaxID=2695274 RepID=A0A7K1XSA6_9SPHI|nr:hypothetical protein [Hufsiella ginkgonis]MXV13893.1 hypothetical protein [Hufsiella ginkgonis]
MAKDDPRLLVILTSRAHFNARDLDTPLNTIVLLGENCRHTETTLHYRGVRKYLHKVVKAHSVYKLAFISQSNNFETTSLADELKSETGSPLTIIIPYLAPPLFGPRQDGRIGSFILHESAGVKSFAFSIGNSFINLLYRVVTAKVNGSRPGGISVLQIGKPLTKADSGTDTERHLCDSLVVIPHKGPLNLLKRCLSSFEGNKVVPASINLCFDDRSYKPFNQAVPDLCCTLNVFKNTPLNTGPYPARHESISTATARFVFFQDSDDISLDGRFSRQMEELHSRKLDMIGCHELRINQFDKCVEAIRFPFDASQSLEKRYFHSLYHPTALITRESYLRTGGFSTDRKFGYDSQFLLRSYFYLRSGNADDFFYIRFKRPNSLTTHPDTMIGSKLRDFLMWRWTIDFRLIQENKLDIKHSSLAVHARNLPFKLVRIAPDQ